MSRQLTLSFFLSLFYIPTAQYLLSWEAVRAASASSSHSHLTHGLLHVCHDRYSNTLLVSLNNRISFRDASRAAGGLVDLQAVSPPNNGDSPQATTETIVTGPETSQNNLIAQSAEGSIV